MTYDFENVRAGHWCLVQFARLSENEMEIAQVAARDAIKGGDLDEFNREYAEKFVAFYERHKAIEREIPSSHPDYQRSVTVAKMVENIQSDEIDYFTVPPAKGFLVGRELARDDSFEEILTKSEQDPIAYEVALRLAGIYVSKSEIPDSVKEFIRGVLRGEIRRPKTRGKHPDAYLARDREVVMLVRFCIDRGFIATRNDASEHRDSACDLVAEALRQIGLEKASYEFVKRIWLKGRGTDFPK